MTHRSTAGQPSAADGWSESAAAIASVHNEALLAGSLLQERQGLRMEYSAVSVRLPVSAHYAGSPSASGPLRCWVGLHQQEGQATLAETTSSEAVGSGRSAQDAPSGTVTTA